MQASIVIIIIIIIIKTIIVTSQLVIYLASISELNYTDSYLPNVSIYCLKQQFQLIFLFVFNF